MFYCVFFEEYCFLNRGLAVYHTKSSNSIAYLYKFRYNVTVVTNEKKERGYERQRIKPSVPTEKVTPELTVTSIVMGIILAVVLVHETHILDYVLV